MSWLLEQAAVPPGQARQVEAGTGPFFGARQGQGRRPRARSPHARASFALKKPFAARQAASASGLVPGSAAQGTPDGGPVGLPRASKPHTGCDAPDSSSGSGWFGGAWGVAQGGLCSNYRQRPGSGGEDREKWQALSLGWSPTEHGEQLTVRSSRVRSRLGNKLSSVHAIRGRCLRTYPPGLRRGPSGTGATAA